MASEIRKNIAQLISAISHACGGDTKQFLREYTRQLFIDNLGNEEKLHAALDDVLNSLLAAGFDYPEQLMKKGCERAPTLKDEPRGNLTHWWDEHGDCALCETNKLATQYLKGKIYTIYPKSK